MPRGVRPFFAGRLPQPSPYYAISGVTRDSAGAVLGTCVIDLFLTETDLKIDTTTSDANGVFEFRSTAPITNYYMVAYKAGSPDVAGVTANTLTGSGT